MKNQIEKLQKLLEEHQKILLINHIRMDGDAWGSLGWLALILQQMWKQVCAINDEHVPPWLQFLWHTDIITPELDVESFSPDICISLDAANEERLWESYKRWKHVFDMVPFVVIDHHISNYGFGDINIIDTSASSVCELLTHILEDMWLEKYITPTAATFLYTGIQTDTNMYATNNTTPSTLRAGAKLIELWANFILPIEKCFREKTPKQIQVWKLAYSKTTISKDGFISSAIITSEDLEDTGIDSETLWENLKWFINETLLNIEWVKVAFLLYPLKNGEIKGSFRCVEWYDVNALCQKFGWWGHIQAAGFQTQADIHTLEKNLLTSISDIL